jgi:hypothetical protein
MRSALAERRVRGRLMRMPWNTARALPKSTRVSLVKLPESVTVWPPATGPALGVTVCRTGAASYR